ncbi:MAG TPA: DUF2735 domain-containing protein [Bradyrhizobium sp.]|nr:DUF2735 domain-containing protein [Bradyrhizobium sp.]
MMNSRLNQGTAKIYQFPAGGRSALAARRLGEARLAPELATTPRVNAPICSDSWYHEAAIRDAHPEREH